MTEYAGLGSTRRCVRNAESVKGQRVGANSHEKLWGPWYLDVEEIDVGGICNRPALGFKQTGASFGHEKAEKKGFD